LGRFAFDGQIRLSQFVPEPLDRYLDGGFRRPRRRLDPSRRSVAVVRDPPPFGAVRVIEYLETMRHASWSAFDGGETDHVDQMLIAGVVEGHLVPWVPRAGFGSTPPSPAPRTKRRFSSLGTRDGPARASTTCRSSACSGSEPLLSASKYRPAMSSNAVRADSP
jgi:hypothetical protein